MTTEWREEKLEIEHRYTKETLGFKREITLSVDGVVQSTMHMNLGPNDSHLSDQEYVKQHHNEHIIGMMERVHKEVYGQ